MKKLMTLLVALVIAIALIPAVFAADTIITSQPVDVVAPLGSYAEFTVEAADAASYQWQYHAAGATEFANCGGTFGGVKTATLSVFSKAAREGMVFRCIVKDAAGNEYISDEATLTTSSIFAAGPADETVMLGSRANFTFELAEGVDPDSIKIQWQYHIPGQDPNYWPNCTPFTMGYNQTTLNVIAAEKRQGFTYRVRVTDAEGNKFFSSAYFTPAVLTVDVPSPYAITVQPADAISNNGAKVSFHVETQGEGLKYQWYYHRDINKTGGQYYWVKMNAADAKTATLSVFGHTKNASGTITTNRDGWYYQCEITDADGYIYTTQPARLWVTTASVVASPESYYGPTGAKVTYSATVDGEYEDVTWQFSSNGGKTYNKSSAAVTKTVDGTKTTFSIKVDATAARNGYLYRIVVKDKTPEREFKDGVTVGKYLFYSEPGALIIDSGNAVTITTNPESVTVEEGETATFTGAATGDAVTLQWWVKAADSEDWYILVGETSETLTVEGIEANNGKSYKLVATDFGGNTAESAAAVLELNAELVLTPNAIPGTATTKTIAAGATKTYTVNAGACNMIIESETVTVAYNGTTYEPIDGVVTVPLEFVNPRLGTSNVVDITNTGDAAAVYTVKFEYPLGSMENPEEITDLSFFYAEQPANDTDGYNFKWTAPEDGTFTLNLQCYAEGADYNAYVTVGYTQYNWAEEAVDGILTFDVEAGEEVLINAFVLSQYEIDEDWNVVVDEEGNPVVVYNPESSIYLYATFVSGSEAYPYDLSPESVPGSAVTNEIAAGEGEYYTTTASGTVVTFNSQNVEVEYEGETYTAANGVVSFYVEGGFDPMTRMPKPIVFKFTNVGTAAAAFTANYSYPAGHSENPDALVIGDNTASFEQGDEPYYYTWTANAAGTVTVTVSAENGWFFCVNNLTANTYGDNNYYTDDPQVNTVELAVEAGDVLQVIVSSYDADMWGSVDGSVTVNFAFDSLINEDIEIPLPGQPEDGEE